MNQNSLCEYPYRPNRLAGAVLLVLACAGAVLCGYLALYADRGGRSARGLELTRDQLRVAAAVAAVLSPLGIAALAIHWVRALRCRRRVVLGEEAIIVPVDGLSRSSRDEVEIPLREIASVTVEHMSGRDYALRIIHAAGTVVLLSDRFARRRDFHRFAQQLARALAPPLTAERA